MVARSDFPSLGFSRVNLAQFTRSLSLRHFLKDFFLLLEIVTKDIIYHKRDDVTNRRRSVVSSRPVLAGVGVNGLTDYYRGLQRSALSNFAVALVLHCYAL